MFTVTVTIGLILTYLFVLIPMKQAQENKARRDFDEAMHNLKLRFVRRYYHDALKDLSFADIEERFDIERAYNQITLRRDALHSPSMINSPIYDLGRAFTAQPSDGTVVEKQTP